MENRIYYGEYSLAYWLELMLKKRIELPSYQRHFVWSEDKLKALIKSIADDQFIPPVTISLFKDGDGKTVHYI